MVEIGVEWDGVDIDGQMSLAKGCFRVAAGDAETGEVQDHHVIFRAAGH